MMIVFTSQILSLLSVSLLILLRETNSATVTMLVKLGSTVDIHFGDNVKAVEAEKMIVKDDKLTDFAREKFGNRIKWYNGKMTIKNIRSSDLSTFFYHSYGKPMALSLEEER
uniref:Copper amine oxidase-like N-terminal domain-containing protein n=1 Tax=Wuchereria bancrofti TaxID=6293 RepID=A0AAF5Q482_WUCBA